MGYSSFRGQVRRAPVVPPWQEDAQSRISGSRLEAACCLCVRPRASLGFPQHLWPRLQELLRCPWILDISPEISPQEPRGHF